MKNEEVEKLIEKMGEAIQEKVHNDIKENNKKIRDTTILVVQFIVLFFVAYLEVSK